jgi:hypothetical protein
MNEINAPTGALFKALAAAQAEMESAKKDAANPFFKSKYADLAEVVRVSKVIHKHGLSVMQMPVGKNELVTILAHESGEYIKSCYEMTPVKNDPQGVGSCITYQRRYALQAILGIPAEDDDGNAASSNVPEKPQKPVINYAAAGLPEKEINAIKESILKAGMTAQDCVAKFGFWPPANKEQWLQVQKFTKERT